MTEAEIIEKLRRRLPARDRRLVLGIGDDCAIYRPDEGEELVFTTDMFLEGVHFRQGTPAVVAGEKALARGLSDIAAMGADSRFCLLSLAAPDAAFVDEFYAGVAALAARTHTDIAGGDLGRSERVICDVVVCGSVPLGQALTRNHAFAGHELYVSGPLGRAASRNYEDVPEPRLDFGLQLRGRAGACMDVSDGLAIDLSRMLTASGTAAVIEDVPLFAGATLEQALYGGEDYELLFTAEPGADVPGIRIGRIVNGPVGSIEMCGAPVPPRGYDHFA